MPEEEQEESQTKSAAAEKAKSKGKNLAKKAGTEAVDKVGKFMVGPLPVGGWCCLISCAWFLLCCFLALVIWVAMYVGLGKGLTIDGGTIATGDLAELACSYGQNPKAYADKYCGGNLGITTCYTACDWFVSRMIHDSIDPGAPYPSGGVPNLQSYLDKHPEKYQPITVSSTQDLQPGDILIRPGKHTAIYCGNGQISHASIGSKPPRITNWYPAMSRAYRLKK